ncbi:hypothetical protein D3C78_1344810 [compost metagenome]
MVRADQGSSKAVLPADLAVALTTEPRRMPSGKSLRVTLTCTVPVWADTAGVISRTVPVVLTAGLSNKLMVIAGSEGGSLNSDS